MSQNAVAPSTACRNCGTGLVGQFCHGCGEPKPDHHEYQWKHMVHDATHEFLHLDGKIFRTLGLLLVRAGFLTQEYWAGRRTAYIRPLRLYIFVATLHLLAVSHTLYRIENIRAGNWGRPLTSMFERVSERTHKPLAELDEEANRNMSKAYAIAQYFAVLGFALAPWAIYRRRTPFYVQHFVFALHVYSFYFLVTGFIGLFITANQWVRSPSYLITFIYLVFALRRLYGESWKGAIWKGLLLRVGLLFTEAAVIGIAMFYAVFRLQLGH